MTWWNQRNNLVNILSVCTWILVEECVTARLAEPRPGLNTVSPSTLRKKTEVTTFLMMFFGTRWL